MLCVELVGMGKRVAAGLEKPEKLDGFQLS